MAQAAYHTSDHHDEAPGGTPSVGRRRATRLRGLLAVVGCAIAVALTSMGGSPFEGGSDVAGLTLWSIGIVAGLVAFVCTVSVFFDVAERFDATP